MEKSETANTTYQEMRLALQLYEIYLTYTSTAYVADSKQRFGTRSSVFSFTHKKYNTVLKGLQ